MTGRQLLGRTRRRLSSQVLCSALTKCVVSGMTMPCAARRAQRRPVGQRREHPCIRPAVATGTGAAIVGGKMRVVAAVRAVTDDHHQRREVRRQADAAQEAADARDLLVFAEAKPRRLGAGDAASLRRPRQSAAGRLAAASRRRRASGRAVAPRRPGASVRASSPSRAHGAAAAISSAAAGSRAGCPGAAAPAKPGAAAPALMHAVGRLAAGRHFFAHGILRAHDDRTQGRRCLVVKALPEHRQAEESGRAEGLDRRIDFFEVASCAFLAVVHAENELRLRLAGSAARGRGWRQRGQNLLPVMVLVGQQPDLAALLVGQRIGTAQQRAAPSAPARAVRGHKAPVAAPGRTAARRPAVASRSLSSAGVAGLGKRTANAASLVNVRGRRSQQRAQPASSSSGNCRLPQACRTASSAG
jgi:hypothetical protein